MSERLRPRSEIVGVGDEESKREAKDEVEDFLDKEAEILSAYGMKGDITLERGARWAFVWELRKLIYDPHYFVERGFSLKETLFATTHELMAHYGELLRDPELVLREAKRYGAKEHLHLLYNIFEDVLGNRRIAAELPFLEETGVKLYREKQFPKTDYREYADHVQFVYGFIREAMVPGEKVMINEKARTALEKLRVFGKDKLDILGLVTTPTIEPKDRFQIMRKIIEPVYLELYQEDLEKEKQRQAAAMPPLQQVAGSKEKQKEGKGFGGGGEGGIGEKELRKQAEEALKKQYKQYQESHPEPLSEEDEENIKKALEANVAKHGGAPSMEKDLLEQWAREHGVKPESVIGYRREYKEIAPLVKELSEVFKKIVSRRLRERWRHAPQLRKEGEEMEESVLAEAYVESRAGGEPAAFRELRREKREQEGYGKLDMTLINDLSGSMGEGEKLAMDRRSKLLFLESLTDFSKEIKEAELESGVSLGLEVRTETRAFGDFGDVELKKMGPELLEKDRIKIWEKLHSAGGGTPDYLSLEQVLGAILPEQEKELKEKTLRKVVVILSDGESENPERVQKTLKELRRKGVIVLGLGMTDSGVAVMNTYAPDASVVKDIRILPKEVQKIILKYTKDL